MSQYTGKQRIAAAMKRQFADRVPVSLPVAPYSAKLLGYSIREFYDDPDKRVASLKKAYEMFRPDTMGTGADASSIADVLGGEVADPEDATLALKSQVLEDKDALADMEVPDPKKAPRFQVYLECCRRLKSEITDISIGGMMLGPWSTAGLMRGVENLIYDTVDTPDFVHELMRFTTELTKRYGSAVRESGVGLSMADPSAGCSLISPKVYREFVKPYHEDIIQYFKERKTWISLHICGYVDPIMEDLAALGTGSISIDGPSSLQKMVEASQRKVAIIGNVPTELFLEGTKEQIEEAVKNCIDIAAKESGYVLCSGCSIPFNAPVENVNWFVEAAHKYGSYST